ncbi:hypothetical protein GCM10027040_23810 [Halomonas shantousis]
MKRAIGMAVANWLRKPENRQKAKRTAQKLWNKRQGRKGSWDNNGPQQ